MPDSAPDTHAHATHLDPGTVADLQRWVGRTETLTPPMTMFFRSQSKRLNCRRLPSAVS